VVKPRDDTILCAMTYSRWDDIILYAMAKAVRDDIFGGLLEQLAGDVWWQVAFLFDVILVVAFLNRNQVEDAFNV